MFHCGNNKVFFIPERFLAIRVTPDPPPLGFNNESLSSLQPSPVGFNHREDPAPFPRGRRGLPKQAHEQVRRCGAPAGLPRPARETVPVWWQKSDIVLFWRLGATLPKGNVRRKPQERK